MQTMRDSSLHPAARASPVQEWIVVCIGISACRGLLSRCCSVRGLRGGGEFGTLKRHTQQSEGEETGVRQGRLF